jgi:hypothetical protein
VRRFSASSSTPKLRANAVRSSPETNEVKVGSLGDPTTTNESLNNNFDRKTIAWTAAISLTTPSRIAGCR